MTKFTDHHNQTERYESWRIKLLFSGLVCIVVCQAAYIIFGTASFPHHVPGILELKEPIATYLPRYQKHVNSSALYVELAQLPHTTQTQSSFEGVAVTTFLGSPKLVPVIFTNVIMF